MKCRYFCVFVFLACSLLLFQKITNAGDIIQVKPVELYTSRHTSSALLAKTDYYSKARKYFEERKRPLHHFLDIGVGATLIESFYPFEMTAWPFFVYVNYRREKWGQTKIPLIFSFQYESLFNSEVSNRVYALTGMRYPLTNDLSLFHVDFMAGVSFSLKSSDLKKDKIAMELRLLLTHVIGPKASPYRLYFQWGAKARVTNPFQSGLIVQLGLDSHL